MAQLYFIRDGIHTHLVLPAELLFERLPSLEKVIGNCNWISTGWGDFHYYGAPNQNRLKGLKALFLPSKAVIEARGLTDPHAGVSPRGRLYEIASTKPILEAVADFVGSHFLVDSNGEPLWVRAKATGEQFYAATGVYTIANTCNNWTARGLHLAGLKTRPFWHFFAGQVERSVLRNGVPQVSTSHS